jgi:hypothetical protein
VPADVDRHWRRCIDTALPAPDDVSRWDDAAVVAQASYAVQPRSIALLALRLDADDRRMNARG